MAKRASMREGPLAALFRDTEEALEGEEIEIQHVNGASSASPAAAPTTSVGLVEEELAEVEADELEVVEPEPAPETELEQEAAAAPEAEVEVIEAPAPKPKPTRKPKRKPAPKRKPKARKAKPKPKAKSRAKPAPRPVAEPEVVEEADAVAEPEAYRETEEPAPHIPAPRERLQRLVSNPIQAQPQGPAFGRDEPDPTRYAVAPRSHNALLRVVGVGGAGVNAVNRMVQAQIPGVEFAAVNTDLQSLQTSNADITLHIGSELTRGLGSGADPRVGYRAAFEEQDKIKDLLKGSDMVFVTCGAGGGTGTGAAPVIAKLARDVGALAVGIVTKPFSFEGARRAAQAEEGIAALGSEVDTLIVVPNERLLTILERKTSIVDAFRVADDVLRQAVQGISDMVMLPGLINLDFADVRTTMLEAGDAILGIGMGSGEHRAIHAAEKAVSSPLLETSVDGARSLLLSITGGPDLSLIEASEAANIVQEAAHPEANIIFGANVDEDLTEQVWVTVIATRFDSAYARRYQRHNGSKNGLRPPRNPEAELSHVDVPEFIPGH